MHLSVKRFLKDVRREYPHKFRLRKVLEIGSKNINGSPRKYFWFCDYTGVDLSEGKGVNVVGRLNYLYYHAGFFSNTKYDVVLSCEMLEHDNTWDVSLYIMYQLLKPGGLMTITCASDDRMEHGTKATTPFASPDTTDYYRNISKGDFRSVLPEKLFTAYVLMNARDKQDLYFYGIKK